MQWKAAFVVVSSLSLLVAGQAAAEEEGTDHGRLGGYAGGGLGLGFAEFTGDGAGKLDFSTGVGLDVWAGYRLLPNVAFEAQLEYLDRFNAGPLEMSVLTFTGNIKGYFSTGQFQPFGVVGVGVTRGSAELGGASGSGSGFAARLGAGADYWLTESVSVGATYSYVFTTGGADGLDYQSFVMGAQYRF